MQNTNGPSSHVTCQLAHDLLNKLTAIVGHCDILDTHEHPSSVECHDRLHRIRALACLMAAMLHEQQCGVFAVPSS